MARKDEPRAKLGWVLDGEFRFEPHRGPNRLAADALVKAIRSLDALTDVDEVLTATASMLGEAVDADPTNAALWGQYRAAVDQLRGVGASGDDDAFSKFLADLSATEVRDTPQP